MKPLWGKLRNSYFLYKSQIRATLVEDSMGTGPFNFFRCKGVIFGGSSTLLKGNQMSCVLINPFPQTCKTVWQWAHWIFEHVISTYSKSSFQRTSWTHPLPKGPVIQSLSWKPWEWLRVGHQSLKKDDSTVIKWLKFTPLVIGKTGPYLLTQCTEKDAASPVFIPAKHM